MKVRHILSVALAALLMTGGINAQSLSPSTKTHWEKGTLVVETPERPAGQQHALGLTAPKLETVRVAFVGLGMRGPGAVTRFCHIPGVEIVALCDYEEARAEACQKSLREQGLKPADIYFGEKGYEELCKRDDIDLVYIATDWNHHFPVAKFAMQNGKHAAIEVPSAMNLQQCWELINLSEKTRKHCMILENCCYDWFELDALNMAQKGILGEVLYAKGAYIHNLDPFWKEYHSNWRLRYNATHRGDVYPTHGIGPVCQVLDIHRGDKMDYLVSMDTKAVNGKAIAQEQLSAEERAELGIGADDFANGDHVATLIRTANGKQIEIQHNVYTRRPYNRMYSLTGVDGYACKYPVEGFALKTENLSQEGLDYQNLDGERFVSDEIRAELMEQYRHPIVAEIEAKAKEVGGHGGMDFIMDYRLIYCLRNGLPLDQDVYDAAEWSCLGELTRVSIENGNIPVVMPDFTRGDWNKTDGLKLAIKE